MTGTGDSGPAAGAPPVSIACQDGHCITCSDEALEVCVVRVDQDAALARVAIRGVEEDVDISLVDAVAPGDTLLVHGGVAIARL